MDRNHRRRFGQNFLDHSTAATLAHDLPVQPEQTILEIGPGHGALTQHLLPKCKQLFAIDIDEQCLQTLSKEIPSQEQGKLHLIHSDFLQFNLEDFLAKHPQCWITGNLPYNVSTAILSRILPWIGQTMGIMAMVQLEVAERLCAHPGTRAWGSLSVWTDFWAERVMLRTIGPEHFHPRPHVDSATLLLTPKASPLAEPEGFFPFVQKCFRHKRKRLSNNLADIDKSLLIESLQNLDLTLDVRAEELSTQQFLQLFHILHP